MATLVLSAVGQAVAGPIGAFVGAVVGNQIDNRVFDRNIRREGPRLSDLSVQGAAYGAPIALGYGRSRMAGNVIWSTGLIEQRREERTSSGGKGGGGGRTTTVSFTYSASFAVALSGRPIQRVERIWADGKLIRNSGAPLNIGGAMRVYTGAEAQLPDPLIEALQGIGQVPAHRGLAYVVFEDLPLAEFANRIPNLSFEVVADEGAVTIGVIAGDLIGRADSGLVTDIGSVTQSLTGYSLVQPLTLRAALQPLGELHPFQLIAQDGILSFQTLPTGPQASLPKSALGADTGGRTPARLEASRQQEFELPREVTVHFLDAARDFQPSVQRARRLTAATPMVETLELAVATSADDAKRAAERRLAMRWSARDNLAVTLPPAHLALQPGDFVEIADADGNRQGLLVAEQQWEHGRLRLSGPRYDPADLDSDAVADGGPFAGQNPQTQGPTRLVLMNLPSLPGDPLASPRFRAAAGGDTEAWRLALLAMSLDGGASYDDIARLDAPAVIGETLSILPPRHGALWDRYSSLDVRVLHEGMSLESRPELAILNGGNAALVGHEIIQFTTVSQIAPAQYRLRNLLRGRLGTEHHIVDHGIGDRFIFLNGALAAIDTSLGALGSPRQFKAAGPNESLAAITAVDFTYDGTNLKPLSPVHLRASRAADGSLNLKWIRRSRQGFDWIAGADAPLGEESEAYEIDILSGGNVLRTLATSVSQAVYTAQQQLADFGALPSQIGVNIYQLSASVGRGQPLHAVI
ncbi:MAG: hypothetical protein Tsb0016_26440 [Sphingomonadales bacterium]